jgi:hypothetical protein
MGGYGVRKLGAKGATEGKLRETLIRNDHEGFFYFRVSPRSAHQAILTLEARGLIERTPGWARSIGFLISLEGLSGSA